MPEPSPSLSLPALESTLAPDEILARFDALSKRGKLAGFEKGPAPLLFQAAAFGNPFDYRLCATASTNSSGTRLAFTLRLPRKIPIIYALVVLLSIWPGVWLTDSMLRTYFSWYTISMWGTCAWYLPLAVLPLPWMYKKHFVGSRIAATADATELIAKITPEINGRAST